MSNKILVTDSLFIFDEHIKQLEAAGYEVERLDKPEAPEEELKEAIKGKVGYILGGVEHVTQSIIVAADELKVIVFAGSDWAGYIPAHKLATEKGIAIANAPGANKYAVAEYTISLLMMMLRHVLELGRTGTKNFMTTDSLPDVKVGVVGLGRIGEQVIRMLRGVGAGEIIYWNRTRKNELEQELNIKYVELEELVRQADIITNHLASTAGLVFDKTLLGQLKKNSLVINTGSDHNFDHEALYELLLQGHIRAAFDYQPKNTQLDNLSVGTWFCTHGDGTAYNTNQANKLASDMAVKSILNILKSGEDQYLVNSRDINRLAP